MKNPNFITHEEIEIFVHLFMMHSSHINIQEIPYITIQEFLSRDYIRKHGIDKQLDLFADYCMANQLCYVQV